MKNGHEPVREDTELQIRELRTIISAMRRQMEEVFMGRDDLVDRAVKTYQAENLELQNTVQGIRGELEDVRQDASRRVKYFDPNFFQIVYISRPKRFQIKDPNTLGFGSKDPPGPRDCRAQALGKGLTSDPLV